MSYNISQVKWQQAAPLLKKVREKVFVCERRIPKNLEFDQGDKTAYHMLICDGMSKEPIATGRITPKGEISRIAVVMSYRSKRIDKFIMQGLFKIAKKLKLKEVFITSPLEKVTYFAQHDFYAIGSVYMEAGIAQQRMACKISSAVKHAKKAKYYLNH